MNSVLRPTVRLQALPTVPMYELVMLNGQLPPDFPRGSGEARRKPGGGGDCSGGDGEILRIGADRWLLVRPQPALVVAGAPLCALTDVTGKWREFRLTGLSAARLLSNSVDVEEMFGERDCARTSLFDCPALLLKRGDGFSVWIERSYEHAFVMAADQALAAQTRALAAPASTT